MLEALEEAKKFKLTKTKIEYMKFYLHNKKRIEGTIKRDKERILRFRYLRSNKKEILDKIHAIDSKELR